jgi:Lantibiotic biosynthesis dehydratase C-term
MSAGSNYAWHGLFAYHAEDRWDGLMRSVLAACAEDAARTGCEFRLTREWQRGPHLHVGVRGAADDAATARELVSARLSEVLRDHPSTRALKLEAVRDQVERLAASSGAPVRTDWLADNTLTWSGSQTSGEHADLAALLEEFHFTASTPALRLLSALVDGASLGAACCDLMAATAQTFGRNGLVAASTSFRSHAEAYLAMEAAPGTRQTWDAEAGRAAGALRQRLFAIADGYRPAHVAEWLDAVTPVLEIARTLHRRGALNIPTVDGGFSPQLTERSPFHRAVSGGADWQALLAAEWFQIFRLALNLLYLQFSRMGIRPAARYRLCHLVATAVGASVTGVPQNDPAAAQRQPQTVPAASGRPHSDDSEEPQR